MTPVEEVKSRLDVVEVVAEYVRLTPAGGQSLRGLCPFHGEKTPSFFVHRDRQFWHCFGCNEGGDVISFYQKIESLDFPDALADLATRVGLELKPVDAQDRSERAAILESLEDATRYYQACLKHEGIGPRARRYLDGRGLTAETIADFRLGYAPDSWEGLTKALLKRGHKPEMLVAAGLVLASDKGRGHYDRFRDRIMIPFRDERGNVIGFTGRILPDSPDKDKSGKYVNSPETKVFHKRDFVFALDLAKKQIKAADFAVLVEGNMDAISSHQAGIKNVVAVSGTAFSEDQVRILKRHCTRLALAFDADLAGQNAMTRAIGYAWSHDLEMRVVYLPPGFKDPDDVIRKDPTLWRQAIEGSKEIVAHAVEQALTGVRPEQLSSLVSAIKLLKPIFRTMGSNPAMYDHWTHKVAERLHISDERVRELLRPDAVELKATGPVPKAPVIETREERLAERLLGLMLTDKATFDSALPRLNSEYFPEGSLRILAKKLKELYTGADASPFEPRAFFASYEAMRLSNSDLPAIEPLVMLKERDMAGWSDVQISDETTACLRELEKAARHRAAKELLAALGDAEKRGDAAQAASIAKKLEEMLKPGE
jgi:DNA primase